MVLSQICDIKTSVPDSFKRALIAWVGQGHKLIIHDSDSVRRNHRPDYSFLPYRFATSNPGKHGADSEKLTFVEENTLATLEAAIQRSSTSTRGQTRSNELGDSNTVKDVRPALVRRCSITRNVLNVNGFVETYAHYGRGLIIYDGFDYDQAMNAQYRQLATPRARAAVRPRRPAVHARLSDFVITTEPGAADAVHVARRRPTAIRSR